MTRIHNTYICIYIYVHTERNRWRERPSGPILARELPADPGSSGACSNGVVMVQAWLTQWLKNGLFINVMVIPWIIMYPLTNQCL